MESRRILCKFFHGLGDNIQFTVVLRHFLKHRPDWITDVVTEAGKASAFRHLCNKAYVDNVDPRPPESDYFHVFDFGWYENYNNYTDRPCTKITNALHEVCGIDYDLSLARYSVSYTPEESLRAKSWLTNAAQCQTLANGRLNAVIIHYEGNTSPEKKNMDHGTIRHLCSNLRRCGFVPVVLDFDGRSPVVDHKTVFNPGVGPGDIWGNFGSGEASVIAALIDAASLFVGIDSGPGKVASSCSTPTIIVWKDHHPIQFHDPAPNTLHLVPANHVVPPSHIPEIQAYFAAHYKFTTYGHLHYDLSEQVRRILGLGDIFHDAMRGKAMGVLNSTKFDQVYYDEHKAAGLDYLGHGPWQEEYGKWVVESLGLAGKTILDVGCACGSICLGLKKAGANPIGFDLNNTMIYLGRQHFPDLVLAVCDAVNLHLVDDESIDLHHSNQVGEHWRPDHVPLIFAEAWRVMKPGALLFLVTDTTDLFERQKRQDEAEDPTNRCIKPLQWWRDELAKAGFVPEPNGETSLRSHPMSFLKRYDWDWVLVRKPV